MDQCVSSSLFTTSITQAEMLYGVALLPKGQRQNAIQKAINTMFTIDFLNRVLPFDPSAASSFATISAARRKLGRPISQLDAQIAAIAHSRAARLATRNVDDFADCDIEIINPWD